MNFIFCDKAMAAAKAAWELMAPAQREEFIRWARPSREYVKAAIPSALRWQIWNRDGFKCHYCGSSKNLSIDHIVAESRGGTLAEANLLTACTSCNSAKGTKDFRSFLLDRELRRICQTTISEIMAENPTPEELRQVAELLFSLANDAETDAAQLEEAQ